MNVEIPQMIEPRHAEAHVRATVRQFFYYGSATFECIMAVILFG
jgi:hypothetical protein